MVVYFPDDRTPRGLSPALVGLVLGTCAAIPMYLWQWNMEIAVASFLIAGHTTWLWTVSHNHAIMHAQLSAELRAHPINRSGRRVGRMVASPGFWWTMIFGGMVVSGSVWYAGVQVPLVVVGIAVVWALVTSCLRFELTLIRPTSCCRRCGYNLSAHLVQPGDTSAVICPECGTRWSRAQLGHVSSTLVDWRRRAA